MTMHDLSTSFDLEPTIISIQITSSHRSRATCFYGGFYLYDHSTQKLADLLRPTVDATFINVVRLH